MGAQTTETQPEKESKTSGVSPDADAAGITLNSLRKEYDDVVAVEDLSLEVESGEFLVLLGPSGCGKSTTLRMIAGLETPTSGQIEIGDDDVTRTLPQKRELSMVFQSYALYPHKTVRQNLAFPLGKLDVDDDEKAQKIEQTAELLEISDLLDKKPGQLSGGQRQRVAVGRTIIREPKAFLMDEPLSNLDAQLRVQTRFEIRELQQRLGTTTVYVTHDQEEAMSVADRIAVMNDGQLQQVGSPQQIYEQPVNEFVAGFIGNPAMNFFEVEATSDETIELWPNTESSVGLDVSLPTQTETLGVRPENVHLSIEDGVATNREHATPDETTVSFTCEVNVIEPLGNAYELELHRGEESFVARLRDLPDEVSPGTSMDVVFDTDGLHAFRTDGEAIQ